MLALFIRLRNQVSSLLKREDGQGMVEYGLIIALVAIGLIAVLTAMGGELGNTFTRIKDCLAAAVSSTTC